AEGNLIGRPAIQQFLGTIISDGADGGYFVTTSSFSGGAVKCAATNSIELINGEKLCALMAGAFSDESMQWYDELCVHCGEKVRFGLGELVSERLCVNSHVVKSSFDSNFLIFQSDTNRPICALCGKSMRLI